MENIAIFVHYNGEWEDNIKYINFDVTGILIPNNCSFNDLLKVLGDQLKIEKEKSRLEIKYGVKDGYPALKIENDASLQFYLQLKKKEEDSTRYPLCINFVDSTSHQFTDSASTSQSLSFHDSTNGDSTNIMMDFIDFANYVCKELEAGQPQIVDKETSVITTTTDKEIEVGQVFKDKEILILVLKLYALKNHFQYRVEKSCQRQYYIYCIDNDCKWYLKASKFEATSMFKIRKLNNVHTCSLELRLSDQRQACTNIVSDFIKSKYMNVKTVYTPRDIMRDMKEDYGISLTYKKAWRSKEKAVEKLRGRPDYSYQLIPSFLYMIGQTNPGSYVDYKLKENNTFKFLFMALDGCIKGWRCCRPIIVVDGTFWKSLYGGTLLSACTQDGDARIFPLAFAVVDSENDDSWEWFFIKLKAACGTREGICIFSNMHESIDKAIRKVYPEASHGVCMYHLLNNLKTNFKKEFKKIRNAFLGATKAYTKEQFYDYAKELENIDRRILPYLSNIGYEKWSRAHSIINGYFAFTSNIPELLNASNKVAREMPITTLLEYLRSLVQHWIHTNINIARSTFTKLTKRAEEIMMENLDDSLKLTVDPINDDIFKVLDGKREFIVEMGKRKCTCNRFQMDELPCSHAFAILKKMNQDPYEYCSYFYTKENMISTYEVIIYPVGNESTWEIPVEVQEIKVFPPEGRVKSGRPKRRRYNAACENLNNNKCSRCGQQGHNRKTCSNIPRINSLA